MTVALPYDARYARQTGVESRERAWDQLGRVPFDVLVIGGGATGAGVARDAALRGLTTALVERDDFASGTSSRSSRLIHGGVRYLEYGHFHLVFEASRERQTLMRIAPHLVKPLAFTWPVYAGARVPRWKLGAGLMLYDALALYRNVSPHRRLNTSEVLAAEPALGAEGLVGGARYYDAATDDARLTLATALAAAEAGAVVVNHARVHALTRNPEGAVIGAVAHDALGRGTTRVSARVVVNAAGPWSDTIRRLDEPSAPPSVLGTKGVHLSVPADRVANRGAVTLLSGVDGRVMFVLPSGAQTIIGTTDTATSTTPDEVRATEADIEYLLTSVNGAFPAARLARTDVISAWAGIRPLIAQSATGHAAPGSASREHAIERSPSGVVTVSGGKLTTYRSMAAETVDVVEEALGRAPTPSRTDVLPLPGGDRAMAMTALAREIPELARPLVAGLPYIAAEAVYAADAEMACTLSDVLVRRTHIAFETRDAGRAAARTVAALLSPRLGWSQAETARQLEQYDADAARIFGIDP